MTFRRPSSLTRAIATTTIVAAVLSLLAGCAGRSLNPPPVVEWSNGARPTVTSVNPTPADAAVLYTVRRDDTLASIASRFNTTPTNVAAWNGLAPTARVQPGQILRVAPPAAAPVDTSPVASTQPIGNEGVEQRPLGPAETTPPAIAASPSNAPIKSGPLGVRRPYSDATLAELSRVRTPMPAPRCRGASGDAAHNRAIERHVRRHVGVADGDASEGPFDDRTKGIDFAGNAGDPVLAAADGKVTFSGTGVRGYGKLVIVQHSPDFLSVYAHNRTNLVQEGATVTKGQKIAEMGNTEADAVKLHFEIRRDSKPIDPLQYLPPR